MSDRHDSDREEEREREFVARRRLGRACDRCRKRKVRCDGSETERTTCSNCEDAGQKCTYEANAEPRDRRLADAEYIKTLESENAKLRRLVVELQVKLDEKNASVFARPPTETSASSSPLRISHPPSARGTPTPPTQGALTEDPLVEGFRSLCLGGAQHTRFMGRSSHFQLMKAAFGMKYELIAENASHLDGNVDITMVLPHRRPEFWVHIFDYLPRDPPYTDFPEPTLMAELVDNYFRTIHYDLPLLHQPTFLRSIASGLYLEDEGLGAIVLLVCALGARFSNNPATLPQDAQTWQHAGWRWFEQVRSMRRLIPLTSTTPADIKITALAAAYVNTFATQYTNSSLIGHGLRLAQDLGAHRRLTYGTVPTVEGELHKRAFWCLVAMDRGMAASVGRSCSIQEDDFDVDYPIECDDEYWIAENPQNAFKQPRGKSSSVAYFNWYLKLTEIQARALRTIYSLQGSKAIGDPENAQQCVADLDSELNQWAASLPDHLKYDVAREDMPFAAQAASLQASYHNLRIFIHRPFMSQSHDLSLPFPSTTICTNAARSCIQVCERYFALKGPVHVYQQHVNAMFQSALILLLQAWRQMRVGISIDIATEFGYVNKTLQALKTLELHWDIAGRSWDILSDLMAAVQSRYGGYTRNTPHNGVRSSGVEQAFPTSSIRSQPSPSNTSIMYAPAPTWNAATPVLDSSGPSLAGSSSATSPTGVWSTMAGAPAAASTAAPLEPSPFTRRSASHDLDAAFAAFFPAFTYDDPYVMMTQQLSASGQQFDAEAWLNGGGAGANAGASTAGFAPGL